MVACIRVVVVVGLRVGVLVLLLELGVGTGNAIIKRQSEINRIDINHQLVFNS